jgi:phosphoribosyl 1,2-cyclic phosphate phosphodiesterase
LLRLIPKPTDKVSIHDAYLTFLGTGTSVGVPVIGCVCEVCKSSDPRNNRTRASLFIHTPETQILIDSGPDLREQALRENITSIDAVLYTHSHLDHVVGFDELRAFCWGKKDPLPLYASVSCLKVLIQMFGWAFHVENTHSGYIKPDPRPISKRFTIGDLTIHPLPVVHGTVETHGYRFDTREGFSFAYLPDVKSIPDETMRLLENLDLLIIDSLRHSPHSTHLSLPEALALIDFLSPKRTLLTHLSHELDHAALAASLKNPISPAYDGLKIPLGGNG